MERQKKQREADLRRLDAQVEGQVRPKRKGYMSRAKFKEEKIKWK